MLKVENLYYKYDFAQNSEPAIKNINFELKNNKILAIVGASGSGKSTLAKLLAGLTATQHGSIFLDDEDISKINNLHLKIGVTLQNPENQLFSRTVYDEMIFILENSGYDTDIIDKTIKETASLFDINSETLNSFPPNLSLGTQRKCAIACSTITNPKLLILDEPTASLDPKSKYNLIDFFKIYKEKHDCSIIIISHNIETISTIADEIIIMQNGEKVAQDIPKNIFSKYENLGIFGLRKPQINEVIKLVNSNKKYLKQDIMTIDEAVQEIISITTQK